MRYEEEKQFRSHHQVLDRYSQNYFRISALSSNNTVNKLRR